MGNNMLPYAVAVGEKYTNFISDHQKYIENDKSEEVTLLKNTENSSDSFDYHFFKNGENACTRLSREVVHTYYPYKVDDDEDIWRAHRVLDVLYAANEAAHKLDYSNGNNEMVKILNQKCIKYLENRSAYDYGNCGNQCICESCYQNKDDVDILKCVMILELS